MTVSIGLSCVLISKYRQRQLTWILRWKYSPDEATSDHARVTLNVYEDESYGNHTDEHQITSQYWNNNDNNMIQDDANAAVIYVIHTPVPYM